jgi:hypothetical protein
MEARELGHEKHDIKTSQGRQNRTGGRVLDAIRREGHRDNRRYMPALYLHLKICVAKSSRTEVAAKQAHEIV